MVSTDGQQLHMHRGMGHVIDVFTPDHLEKLKGDAAIGHVRYSTAGGSHLKNAQPIAVDYARGSIAIGHNGNLTNADALREKLEARGSIFQSVADTEVIVHLIAMSTQRLVEDRIADALSRVRGAYSLLCLTEEKMIAARDPMGVRPLCIGRTKDGGAWVVASEATSFDLIDAKLEREVEPGEMIVIDRKHGLRSIKPFPPAPPKSCIFEYVYFARPDSVIDGVSVSVGAAAP